MGHMAKIENGIVTFVTVSSDHDDNRELDISNETGETYRRTSYNTHGGIYYDPVTNQPSSDQSKAYRFNFAGIGWSFDPDFGPDGAFIPPKPYPSWILNSNTALWEPPIPMPINGNWIWDESLQEWKEL